jgi:IS30 family transposase
MTMKSANTDRIESARKILNAAASKIAELEAAGMVLSHVLAETDAELENMAQRRKTILAADAPPAEIDKQLERHDETVRALTRRNEIAAAVSTNLVTRIAADREVERAAKRRTNYDRRSSLSSITETRVQRASSSAMAIERRLRL